MTEIIPEAKKTLPDFRTGDTVRVHAKVVESGHERLQVFEGIVLLRRGKGESQSFTVRKTSFGVGVERTFPLFSPFIEKIDVVRSGRARRARLYYLRSLSGKAARLAEEDRSAAAPSADSAKNSSKAQPAGEAQQPVPASAADQTGKPAARAATGS